MLKMIVCGNLVNDVLLRTYEDTGKHYAILRVAVNRRYKHPDGTRSTDFVSVKVRGKLAEYCAEYAKKGCRLEAFGDAEICPRDTPECRNDILVKADTVELPFPPKNAEPDTENAGEPV